MSSNRQPVTITEPGLLSLLQISDSFFPTGAFAQSYGLETYVQEGLVNSKETLVQFLTTYLLDSVATSDCLAMLLARRAAVKEDLSTILELDQILAAQKMARESREASAKTGSRMLQAALRLFPSAWLDEFNRILRQGKTYGHHALVFGLVTQVIGLEEKEAALSFVYTTVSAMVNNAVRLVPLGQNDGQWALAALRRVMQEAVETSLSLDLDELGAAAPALEIRSMQHERLYSRLFMS